MCVPFAKAGKLTALAVALALSGCALQMPDTDRMLAEAAPEQWSVPYIQKGDAIEMERFWEAWHEPELKALIERAQAANPDVLTALASLRSARASLTAANASLWPTASIGASAETRRADSRTEEAYGADANGAWTINLAGGTLAERDAAVFNAYAKSLTVADTRELVAAETAQAYINLRAARAQLEIQKFSIKNSEETAAVARWRADAGLASRSEAEDAEVKLATAKARLPEIEASEAEYRNALARLTAQPADGLNLNNDATVPVPPQGLTVSIPAETLMRRPDIQSALAAIRSAAESLRKAESDYFPTLSLKGSIGTQAASVSALGASGTGIASLVGALTMPILNWGALQAAEESAAAGLDEAKARYVSAVVKALEETDNALQGIRSADAKEALLAKALKHAESSHRLSNLEYRSGIGDYAMLLNAEQSLLSVRESVLSNQAARANEVVMLYRALGGAWGAEQEEKRGIEKTDMQ